MLSFRRICLLLQFAASFCSFDYHPKRLTGPMLYLPFYFS